MTASQKDLKFTSELKIKRNDNVMVIRTLGNKEYLDKLDVIFKGLVSKIKFNSVSILTEENIPENDNIKYLVLKSYNNVTYDRIRLFFKDL